MKERALRGTQIRSTHGMGELKRAQELRVNARQLHGVFFIEPNDEEFKHTMRNARRKLEIRMPAAMPSESPVNCRGEPAAVLGNTIPNILVLSMPTNL